MLIFPCFIGFVPCFALSVLRLLLSHLFDLHNQEPEHRNQEEKGQSDNQAQVDFVPEVLGLHVPCRAQHVA